MIFGINPTSGTSLEAVMDAYLDAKRLGCTMVRVFTSWATVQPTDASHWTWDNFDIKAAAAQSLELDILWTLNAPCPTWANGGVGGYTPPTSNADFAAFCAAAATRYGAQGFHYYEVWNEPDLAAQWVPAANATDYCALLAAATAAIKAADASAFVVSGPLFSPWSTSTFLVDMISAEFYNDCDALGLHPYCTPYWPQDTADSANAFRMISAVGAPYSILSKLSTAGIADFPIWCTEFGIPTYNGNPGEGVLNRQVQNATVNYPKIPHRTNQNCGTEDYQAAVVTNVVARLKLVSNVAAFFWYRQTDGTGNWYGLNRTDGTRKPSWAAYRAATT